MNFNCQKANIPSNFFYCQLSFFTEHLIRNRGFEYWGWFDNATDSNSWEQRWKRIVIWSCLRREERAWESGVDNSWLLIKWTTLRLLLWYFAALLHEDPSPLFIFNFRFWYCFVVLFCFRKCTSGMNIVEWFSQLHRHTIVAVSEMGK